jgi:hypothetical protein
MDQDTPNQNLWIPALVERDRDPAFVSLFLWYAPGWDRYSVRKTLVDKQLGDLETSRVG